MKQRYQILNDPRFHLLYNVRQRFSDGPVPTNLRLNRQGFELVAGLKKKATVSTKALLATHPSPERGDLFSPIHGVITDITERSIFITASTDDHQAPEPETFNFLASDLDPDAMRLKLKQMGLNTKSLTKKCRVQIINALNPDPGVTWVEPMLLSHRPLLFAALELHKRIAQAEEIILALPKGLKVAQEILAVHKVVYVEPEYPNSVDAMLVKEVTGKENPPDVAVVGLHNIWSLGRMVRTGLPLTETIITIGSSEHTGNYIVKDGSLIGELLDFAQIPLKDGDIVVRGGPLRGESIELMSRSITKGSAGLFVVEDGTIPDMEGRSPCINCGACVLVCPARINPCKLSRYAEFALYDRCKKEYISQCMDCGLCSYVCLARRPVLQYIRTAKHKLHEKDLVEIKASN